MSNSMVKEFDDLISSGRLRVRMSGNMSPLDLSDEQKIQMMEIIKAEDPDEEEFF